MKKIVVAITGASGSIYAKRALENLSIIAQKETIEVGVVLSSNALEVWRYELSQPFDFPFKVYDIKDFWAPFASGSARFTEMLIVPCSMGTLGRIANGFSDDLITRAADVILKERRKLICILRDTPYNLIHIQNMEKLTLAGAVVMPASPSFYSRPQTFDQLADTVIHRALDMMGFDLSTFRWGE